MAKLMIVTVGTSLFTSASWDAGNAGFVEKLGESRAREYKNKWANPGDSRSAGGLYSPEQRKREGKTLEPFFAERLTAANAAEWAALAAPHNPTQNRYNMRYSAELATILGYAKNDAGQDWKSFLDEYAIYFIHDNNETQPAYIAAKHNCAYLQTMVKARVEALEISHLSSSVPHQLIEGLKKFQQLLTEAAGAKAGYSAIDIVISGGYKIYGLIAFGFLTSPQYRIIYQHEDSEQVLILQKGSIKIGPHPETTINLIH